MQAAKQNSSADNGLPKQTPNMMRESAARSSTGKGGSKAGNKATHSCRASGSAVGGRGVGENREAQSSGRATASHSVVADEEIGTNAAPRPGEWKDLKAGWIGSIFEVLRSKSGTVMLSMLLLFSMALATGQFGVAVSEGRKCRRWMRDTRSVPSHMCSNSSYTGDEGENGILFWSVSNKELELKCGCVGREDCKWRRRTSLEEAGQYGDVPEFCDGWSVRVALPAALFLRVVTELALVAIPIAIDLRTFGMATPLEIASMSRAEGDIPISGVSGVFLFMAGCVTLVASRKTSAGAVSVTTSLGMIASVIAMVISCLIYIKEAKQNGLCLLLRKIQPVVLGCSILLIDAAQGFLMDGGSSAVTIGLIVADSLVELAEIMLASLGWGFIVRDSEVYIDLLCFREQAVWEQTATNISKISGVRHASIVTVWIGSSKYQTELIENAVTAMRSGPLTGECWCEALGVPKREWAVPASIILLPQWDTEKIKDTGDSVWICVGQRVLECKSDGTTRRARRWPRRNEGFIWRGQLTIHSRDREAGSTGG